MEKLSILFYFYLNVFEKINETEINTDFLRNVSNTLKQKEFMLKRFIILRTDRHYAHKQLKKIQKSYTLG